MEARLREARERRIGFRGRIVGMHEAGQSIRAIANNLGISTRTVRRWIRRAEDTDWRHCWRRNDTRYSPENVFHVARSGHVTVNI
ncbi:hypothetical protein Pcinc_002100 [Petrolisthes cinctipes]|uniref:Uncharacterized protein n=1 Tax=Petrolisthes cinctipes TaxID=88211 RepID=A0AAE1L2I7_PETCI|nr:hypothetical protein Pcinc_002100 [Petrolisthes cinctipes]